MRRYTAGSAAGRHQCTWAHVTWTRSGWGCRRTMASTGLTLAHRKWACVAIYLQAVAVLCIRAMRRNRNAVRPTGEQAEFSSGGGRGSSTACRRTRPYWRPAPVSCERCSNSTIPDENGSCNPFRWEEGDGASGEQETWCHRHTAIDARQMHRVAAFVVECIRRMGIYW